MTESSNRLVNFEYKRATKDIFASLVKVSEVVWATSECTQMNLQGMLVETGNDCLLV